MRPLRRSAPSRERIADARHTVAENLGGKILTGSTAQSRAQFLFSDDAADQETRAVLSAGSWDTRRSVFRSSYVLDSVDAKTPIHPGRYILPSVEIQAFFTTANGRALGQSVAQLQKGGNEKGLGASGPAGAAAVKKAAAKQAETPAAPKLPAPSKAVSLEAFRKGKWKARDLTAASEFEPTMRWSLVTFDNPHYAMQNLSDKEVRKMQKKAAKRERREHRARDKTHKKRRKERTGDGGMDLLTFELSGNAELAKVIRDGIVPETLPVVTTRRWTAEMDKRLTNDSSAKGIKRVAADLNRSVEAVTERVAFLAANARPSQ